MDNSLQWRGGGGVDIIWRREREGHSISIAFSGKVGYGSYLEQHKSNIIISSKTCTVHLFC